MLPTLPRAPSPRPSLCGRYAFAALLQSGAVVAWGDPNAGGVIPNDKVSQLGQGSVIGLYSNEVAFAALLDNGKVVTWGDDDAGGDSSKASPPPPHT